MNGCLHIETIKVWIILKIFRPPFKVIARQRSLLFIRSGEITCSKKESDKNKNFRKENTTAIIPNSVKYLKSENKPEIKQLIIFYQTPFCSSCSNISLEYYGAILASQFKYNICISPIHKFKCHPRAKKYYFKLCRKLYSLIWKNRDMRKLNLVQFCYFPVFKILFLTQTELDVAFTLHDLSLKFCYLTFILGLLS